MTKSTQKTTDEAKARRAKQELAKVYEVRDFETLCYINDTLGTDYGRKTVVQMKCVSRLLKSLEAGERPFPSSQYMRKDAYTNAVKVLAVAIMNLDLATNTIVGFTKGGELIPVGNSLFINTLNMPRRTVDEAIRRLKEMGLYLSNERYKYTLDELGNKIFEGAHSIKRVCLGVFNVFDLEPSLIKSIATAKQKQPELAEKQDKARAAKQCDKDAKSEQAKLAKLGDNYKRAGIKKSYDRAASRLKAKGKKAAAALKVAIKPSNTQAQLEALESGSTREQLKAAFTPAVDNCNDIPF